MRLSSVLLCVVVVWGVTQLHDVVYIVCDSFSAIFRFNATTHERLTDIQVKGLRQPRDIVACEQTSQLYVAMWSANSAVIWRVSVGLDAADIKRWMAKFAFKQTSLSLTSTCLLMTSFNTKQLILFDVNGHQLRLTKLLQLPDDMKPWHAVESPTTTFIVSHNNTKLNQFHISEVNTYGQVLRQFTGSRLLPLGQTPHIAIDSHGNVFVADSDNRRIWLLDAELTLRRVIVDERQLKDKRPSRLCYSESTGLLVGFDDSVAVFDVLCR